MTESGITRRFRSSIIHRVVIRARARATEPYGTHVPVLLALTRLRPIRSVLELGGGNFSTPLFLDRRSFRDLEQLVVVESDAEWLSVVQKHTAGDSRATVTLVPSAASAISDLDIRSFDLIFIDDSAAMDDRARTIREVARRRPTALVAIHDFEVISYRSAARGLGRPFVARDVTPQTGVFGLSRKERAALRRAAP